MTGDVQNHDADVGGIVGYNSGSGVINHCTFYGDRNSSHSQDNVFVGDQDGKLWNAHAGDLSDDATLDNYLSSFSDIESCNLYRCAIQYPNPTDIRNEGYGAMESSFPGAREGKTARLTKAFGSLQSLTITDAYGRTITPSGNETDGYTFTMPRLGVFVKPTFSGNHWLAAHAGTASDPYRISSTEDWKAFAYYVRQGYNFYQQYVQLERDITITTTVGLREEGIYGLLRHLPRWRPYADGQPQQHGHRHGEQRAGRGALPLHLRSHHQGPHRGRHHQLGQLPHGGPRGLRLQHQPH